MARQPSRSRLRRSLSAAQDAASRLLTPPAADRLRFAAELPGPGGKTLFKVAVESLSEPDQLGGERVRMRVHVQANLASVAKPALAALAQRAQQATQRAALPAPSEAPAIGATGTSAVVEALSTALAPARARASGWLAKRASKYLPALQQALDPLIGHDLQSWVDIHSSSAPLDAGAKGLMPAADGLQKLGIVPVDGPEGTPLQVWSGGGVDEQATVALLRLDDHNLPTELRARLGGKPFNLAATFVTVAKRR